MRVGPLIAAAACLAVPACSSDDTTTPTTAAAPSLPPPVPTATAAATTLPNPLATSVTPTPPSTTPPSTEMPDTLLSVADDRLAFTIALPEEHVLTNAFEHDAGDGCVAPVWQLADGVNLEAWPAGCDPANARPGNGSYGHYRTLADVPEPIDPIEIESVLGPTTIVGQPYYECTNSCDEWNLDIAIVELSEPVNSEFPTLTVIGTRRSFERADLLALLEAFGAG